MSLPRIIVFSHATVNKLNGQFTVTGFLTSKEETVV